MANFVFYHYFALLLRSIPRCFKASVIPRITATAQENIRILIHSVWPLSRDTNVYETRKVFHKQKGVDSAATRSTILKECRLLSAPHCKCYEQCCCPKNGMIETRAFAQDIRPFDILGMRLENGTFPWVRMAAIAFRPFQTWNVRMSWCQSLHCSYTFASENAVNDTIAVKLANLNMTKRGEVNYGNGPSMIN